MADDTDEDVYWKEKYLVLETSVERFKFQASKIKETLGSRMKDLEDRRTDAEQRAESAEEKLRLMEQQLAAMNWKPQDFEHRIQELEQECNNKDRCIRDFEVQLEDQRQQRQQDAKVVEEKAARIKDWVTSKLSQLEQQNHELHIQNDILNDQVELLRERLQALPAFAAKEIYRLSQEDFLTHSASSSDIHLPTSLLFSKSQGRPESDDTALHRYSTEAQGSDRQTTYQEHEQDNEDDHEQFSRRMSNSSFSRSRSNSKQLYSRSNSEVPSSRPNSEFTISRPESQVTEPRKVKKRPSSSIIEALQIEQEFFSFGLENDLGSPDCVTPDIEPESASDNGSDDSMADIDHDPLYQEVDQNHESTYEPKKSFPPQIRIERKIFQDIHRMDSFVSSSNDSEDMLERQRPSFTMVDRPVAPVEPMSRSSGFEMFGHSSGFGSLDIEEEIVSPVGSSQMTLTPRSPMTPQLPDLVSTQSMNSPQFRVQHHSSSNVSAIATLPRRRNRPLPPSVQFEYENSVISHLDQPITRREDSHVVSAEIHSAPATVTRQQKQKPSTSGTRTRFNTWDSKAYPARRTRQRTDVKAVLTEPSSAGHLFQDISIPVYASLKGKACQIRSRPFTEETDDESSEEDDGGTEGAESETEVKRIPASPARDRSAGKDVRKKQQINQSSSGAVKRGVLRKSVSSEVSCDYANPPDDNSSRSDSDTSEPEQKLLKYTEGNKHDNLEKCGYLSKLGGKVKTWRKRWFVLRGGELFYYKSQHEVLRNPQGSIKFDDQTKISRSNGELTFEITNAKRTYYLTTDTHTETDRWMKVLQKILKRQATSFLLDHVETKAVIRGCLTKVKNGQTRKCWCVLMGRYFLYYKSASNKSPFGQIHLRDARLEEIDTTSDSDDESDVSMATKHVIAIWPQYQGPTYLIIPTKQEKDSWLYHLTVAAGGGTGNVGSNYEQLIAKVMEVDGDSNSMYWKHPVLLHSKEPISVPLTTLPSEELMKEAVQLFKTVHQFMSTMIESHSLESHVTLAQSALRRCIQHVQLQNELYCQLIKQTSRHPVQHRSTVQNLLLCGKHSWYLCHTTPTSPTNSVLDLTTESKHNPQSYVISQGWQLLAMCVCLFLPKQSVMWLLKVHLHRNADPRTEIGKYAIFCQRALERTVLKGLRESKPSRMEVMSILLRHPYHHSQPISIPVHFLNNSYQVVSFDGSATVEELLTSLNKKMGMRLCEHSGFALFTDDPVEGDTETCLQGHIKVCDVISKWEEVFRDHHAGKLDTSKTIRLLYKSRLYFKSNAYLETDKEKLLLAYQVNEEIICGRFPLNRDLALELASLMAQLEYGDIRSSDSGVAQQTSQAVERFYPRRYRDTHDDDTRSLQERLGERWSALRGRTQQDCVRIYLAVARKWQFCSAKLFLTRVRDSASQDDVWLAIQEEGVAVLEHSTMQPISNYDYRSVVTFGGWNDDLMLVVSQLIESAPHHYEHHTDKLLFILPKAKVLEVTLLIASYINVRAQRVSQEGNGAS